VRAARVNGGGILVDVPDNAFLVHYERGAVGESALFVEDPVFLGNSPLEIAEERVGDLKLLGVFFVGKSAVNADAENLSVGLFEFGDISLIRLELLRSTAGERQNVKRQDDVLLPPEFTELDFLALGVRQSKIRRSVAHHQSCAACERRQGQHAAQ
jgi:hypothetical protein